MEIAKLKVDGVYAGVVMRRTVTAGLVGATISVEYAAGIWEGLTKTVVFRVSVTKDVVTNDTTIEIPWEVLAKPNERLQVGFYGVDAAGKLIIPTVWVDLGRIQPGADPSGDPSTDPSLPVWGQIADRVEGIAQDVEELKQGGGPSIPGVPGADGEDGGYYIPELSQLDEDTIQFAFTPSKADMPAVEPVTVELPVGQGSGGNVENGEDGFSPIATVTQTDSGAVISITDKDGTTTATITNGKDGKDGQDGKTPVRGEDYYTEADKSEMVNAVIAALPVWEGGSY